MEDMEEAKEYYQRSLNLKEEKYGKNSFQSVSNLNNLAILENYEGNYEAAVEY